LPRCASRWRACCCGNCLTARSVGRLRTERRHRRRLPRRNPAGVKVLGSAKRPHNSQASLSLSMVTQCQPPVSTGLQAHTRERDAGHLRSGPGDAGKTTAEEQCEIAVTGRPPVAGEKSNSKTASTPPPPPLAVLPTDESSCRSRLPLADTVCHSEGLPFMTQ
jgi:hypothetical protein